MFFVIMVSFTLIFSVVAAEVVLRLSGFQPWKYLIMDLNEPTVHEPDPILGWQNKAGEYTFTSFSTAAREVTMTFLKGGMRYSGLPQMKEHDDIVFFGGSFTQGWSITDHDTFAWKIQKKIPSVNILNYGAGGYGTYQSLLKLEQIVAGPRRPMQVIYGFISHHQIRNIALSYWIRYLSQFSRRSHVYVPYATVDHSGELKRHAPEGYGPWPLRESSALVAWLQDVYMQHKDKYKFFRVRKVTEKILEEMTRLCERNSIKFTVVLLHVDEKTKHHFIKFFQSRPIDFVDCNFPLTEDMVVPGENHPNGRMNTLWADCITQAINN